MIPIHRPTSDRPHDLGFAPRQMVKWLSPAELANGSLRVVLSSVFGAYADKRELQGVWDAQPHADYSDREEMWFDYVADVADGFDATTSVASALAMESADLQLDKKGEVHHTKRGEALVMGGDQVYPTANYATYRDRLIGPYRAAFPGVAGEGPDLFAVPGNHDWYDGLTAFLRVFCQGERIGAWQTRQDRSYFAMQLPHGWWLFGIDVQFESYIDPAQLRWFRDTIGSQLEHGDSVIMCSAVPTWVDCNRGEPDAYETLDTFDREVVRRHGAEIRIQLAGDKHHYARYNEVGGDRQAITAGGGGAYLAGTHHLPQQITVPPRDAKDLQHTEPIEYALATTYPSRAQSLRLRVGVLRLPFQNGSLWAVVGALYLVIGWGVLLGLRAPNEAFADMLRETTWPGMLNALFLRPFGFLGAVALASGMAAFSKSKELKKRWIFGVFHAIAHLVVMLGTVYVTALFLAGLRDDLYVLMVTLAMFGIGGLAGTWLVSVYLLVADRFRHNTNELFAAQHIEGFNNFLRMHISAAGTLTVYPVKLQQVTRWKFQPEGNDYDPWYVPTNGAPTTELIEAPLRFARRAVSRPAVQETGTVG